MSDRPTPETDAFAKAMYKRGVDCHHDGRKALKHAERLERERNEAREALMKIKEIFIDGGDTYLDFVKVGNIATDYLEGL